MSKPKNDDDKMIFNASYLNDNNDSRVVQGTIGHLYYVVSNNQMKTLISDVFVCHVCCIRFLNYLSQIDKIL